MREYKKENVFNIIRNKKYKKLIPLLVNNFQGVFTTHELKSLILDEKSGLFKTIIIILSEYSEEIEDYYEEHDVEYFMFFDICDMFNNTLKQSLALSVMADPTVNNYSALIEHGFLLDFAIDEILEIFESFDTNRYEAFLRSINLAINELMQYHNNAKSEFFIYLVRLGEYLPESCKKAMVQMILSSKPKPTYLGGEIIRKQWDLPLNLGKIGWFCNLEEKQYQLLIEYIQKNYKDKLIDQSDRSRFRVILRMLRKRLQEFREYPFEELLLTKAQIREFLTRLAREEGCQFTKLKWRCGGKDFIYSKKILNLMKIPTKIQECFFELCKKFGGYCDCEILMNAASWLLQEDTPW